MSEESQNLSPDIKRPDSEVWVIMAVSIAASRFERAAKKNIS
jgi:hypothetical protein